MTLCINGKEREVESKTIGSLIEFLKLPAKAILIEHNGTALLRDEWESQNIQSGDRIEIIRIVAGG